MPCHSLKLIKLHFNGPVHFGNHRLSDGEMTFPSDRFYSALFIESLKLNLSFKEAVEKGDFLISDLLPFNGNELFIPKPNCPNPKQLLKRTAFISLNNVGKYLNQTAFVQEEINFGRHHTTEKVKIAGAQVGTPFVVGSYHFQQDSGLYFFARITDVGEAILTPLLDSLSLTGIGGEKSSGYGGFSYEISEPPKMLQEIQTLILLSTALPAEKELEEALSGARFQLIKRSGFVDSPDYATMPIRKKDIYAIQAGSTFKSPFKGGIYVVGSQGCHPVYRFLLSFFIGG